MNAVIWERLSNGDVISKVVATAGILVVARIAVKILDIVLKRWQGIVVKKLKNSYQMIYSVETRFTVVMRLVAVGVYFFAVMLIFLQFAALRALGTGLLASAGLATIVLGMAAQNTLSNIIAGLSLSFSQPIRLHDAVVLDNEFGFVEEISLMHSIILTWDNRRIIVPNNVMANKVVENWTMKDPSITGSVNFYVDYSCDVDKIREWVRQIVAGSSNTTPERLSAVQVTDFTEHSMVLRILVKGPDPAKTWDLRCEVRENLIKKFKEAGMPLPQMRVDFQGRP